MELLTAVQVLQNVVTTNRDSYDDITGGPEAITCYPEIMKCDDRTEIFSNLKDD